MKWGPIERLIDREVGELCWYLLPYLNPEIKAPPKLARYRAIWHREDDQDLQSIKAADPYVHYPMLMLDSDRQLSSLSGFIYPPKYGDPVRLSIYLEHLRRFLIHRLASGKDATANLIQRAVREYFSISSRTEFIEFLDQLWVGRWIVDDFEWGELRLLALAGGDQEAVAAFQNDQDRLQAEAAKIVQAERKLKDQVSSVEEWLHGIYSFLPSISSIFIALRRSNETQKSDESEKFDRVLDEFLADIHTTLHISIDTEALFDHYIREPLEKAEDIDLAIKHIRGIYRGRTIIPRVWYEALALARSEQIAAPPKGPLAADLVERVHGRLSTNDCLAGVGRALCVDGDPWMALSSIESE